VLALLAEVTEADGTPPVSEAVLLGLRHRGDGAHLLVRSGDRLLGYAHLDETSGTGELAVHQDGRRRGLGGAMVRALLQQAGPGRLRLWAHGEHAAAKRLAGKYGFTVARQLLQLGRSLVEPPLAEPKLPAGVALRPLRVGQDEAAVVEVNNRAFAWHPEQGGWDVEQVRRREAEPWFDAAGFLLAVAEDDGRILGFHWTKAHSAELGEVYVLGVDPAEHGRGLGTALTLAGLHHLRDRGMTTVMLYVEADNAAAVRTYERLGFTRWATDVAYAAPR